MDFIVHSELIFLWHSIPDALGMIAKEHAFEVDIYDIFEVAKIS